MVTRLARLSALESLHTTMHFSSCIEDARPGPALPSGVCQPLSEPHRARRARSRCGGRRRRNVHRAGADVGKDCLIVLATSEDAI